MTSDSTPPPSSCVHNLHREPDVRGAPEPTTLCKNAVGVFHMLDCPLFLGLACTYYEESTGEREVTGDLELDGIGEELRRDFLGWKYTQRVRSLAKPAAELPELLTVEAIDDPEENLEILLAARPGDAGAAAAGAAAEGGDAAASVVVEAVPVADAEPGDEVPAPAAPRRPELYPGQRRSEERTRGGKKPAPVEDRAAPEPSDDEDDGEPVDVEPVEEVRPRTVEELFNTLPEAHLPDKPERPRRGSPAGGGGGGRRGRRGRGGATKPRDGAGPGSGPGTGEGGSGERRGGGSSSKSSKKSSGRRRRGRRGGGSGDGGTPPAGREGGAPREGPRDGARGSDSAPPRGPSGGEGGEGGGNRSRRRRRRGPRRDGGGGGSGGGSAPSGE